MDCLWHKMEAYLQKLVLVVTWEIRSLKVMRLYLVMFCLITFDYIDYIKLYLIVNKCNQIYYIWLEYLCSEFSSYAGKFF